MFEQVATLRGEFYFLVEEPDKISMIEHAEAWATENGETVPARDTPPHTEMYERWVEFAFADFPFGPDNTTELV